MKKVGVLFLLCLLFAGIGISSFAQTVPENIIVDYPLLQSTEVTARKSILLDVGFSATPQNTQFEFGINPYYPFDPPTNGLFATSSGTLTDSPSEGGVVGTIPGALYVSPSGAATYSIPIKCPQGVKGMQPNIALMYSSQNGNGIAGWGWNISGSSSIARTTKTIYHNESVFPYNWWESSDFALDGTRLIILNTHGNDSIEYATENESYSRIVGYNINVMGPETFKVYTKDGKTLFYGKAGDRFATTTLEYHSIYKAYIPSWNLVKILDNNSNSIEFYYTGSTVSTNPYTYQNHRLSYIKYGRNEKVGNKHTHQIAFDYESRPDAMVSYIASKSIMQNYRLTGIRILGNGTTVSKYQLDYIIDTAGKSRLNTITQYGEGEYRFNPTQFEYGDKAQTVSSETIQISNLDSYSTNAKDKFWFAADVDSDGLSDLISSFNWKMPTGVNSYSLKRVFQVYHAERDETGVVSFNSGSVYVGRCPTDIVMESIVSRTGAFRACNYTGKAKPNLVVPHLNKTDYWCQLLFYDLSVNTVFGANLETSTNDLPPYTFGDFNQDGFDDILYIEQKKKDNLFPYKIFWGGKYNTGDPIAVSEGNFDLVDAPQQILPTDYDNDGLTDLLLLSDYGYQYLRNQGGTKDVSDNIVKTNFLPSVSGSGILKYKNRHYTAEPGDFNADGILDFITNEPGSRTWKLQLGNSSGRFSTIVIPEMDALEETYTGMNNEREQCIVTDFNGDGLSDVIIVESDWKEVDPWIGGSWGEFRSSYVAWYRSTGNGFVEEKRIMTNDDDYFYKKFNCIGDFNGDGSIDILTYKSSLNEKISYDTNFHLISRPNTNNNAGLLTSVTNGLGLKEKVEYAPITCSSVYKKKNVEYDHIKDVQLPMYVVSKRQSENGIGGYSTNSYQYSGFKIHTQGKGALGFQETTTINETTGIQVTTNRKINTEYYVLLPEITTTSFGENDLINRSTQDVQPVSISGRRFKMILNSQKTEDFKKGTSVVKSYDEYDNKGNPCSIITKYYEGTSECPVYSEERYGYEQKNGWFTSRPSFKTVTHHNSSGTTAKEKEFSERTEWQYDIRANLTKTTLQPDEVKAISTENLNFDYYGNPALIRTVSEGKTRSQSYTYTPNGKFVKQQTDNFTNFTNIYEYDYKYGRISQETDHLGQVTNHEYDNMGRLTRTTHPGDLHEIKITQWAGYSGPTGSSYFIYSEASGAAPVWKWYDKLGREIRTETYGFDTGRKTIVDKEYNEKGQLWRISKPYFFGGVNSSETVFSYDDYGRQSAISTPMGTSSVNWDRLTVTNTNPSGTKKEIYNAAGQLLSSEVDGVTVEYTYWASGQVKDAKHSQGQPVITEFDVFGNRTKLDDPTVGVITSEYTGFGELDKQRHKKTKEDGTIIEILTDYSYDGAGRIQSVTQSSSDGSSTTNYTYNPQTGLLEKETNEIHEIEYNYDEGRDIKLGLVTSYTEKIDGKNFTFSSLYDEFGREIRHTYPSGYYVNYSHTNYGHLSSISDKNGTNLYQVIAVNEYGQVTQESKNGKTTSYGYDVRQMPTYITSSGVFDQQYVFDAKGNLESRTDNIAEQHEVFTYDEKNQLKTWSPQNVAAAAPWFDYSFENTYDQFGNITSRDDINKIIPEGPSATGPVQFDFKYENNDVINSISSIAGRPDLISGDTQKISYTDFNKVATITEGSRSLSLTYGVDQQRRIGDFGNLKRYYLGDYEEDHENGSVKKVHYLSGANGLAAVYIEENGVGKLYFTYCDYQGSIYVLTDKNGNEEERRAYTPWGRPRKPHNWNYIDEYTSGWLIDRGYTVHEHLHDFDLINMNGRVYDPTIGRFVSPDPHIQSGDHWLNYNRYVYCLNNPMKYTDPTGELYIWDDVIVGAVGFTVGFISYCIQTDDFKWGEAALAGAIGAGTALFGYYTGGGGMSGTTWQTGAKFAGKMVLNNAIGQVMPAQQIPINDKMSVSIAPSLFMGTHSWGGGMELGLHYQDGDNIYSGYLGVNTNGKAFGTEKNTLEFTAGGGFTHKNGEHIYSFALRRYQDISRNETSQFVWMAGYENNAYSINLEEDLFFSDKYRTGALEYTYKYSKDLSFSAGFLVYTGDFINKDVTTYKSIKGNRRKRKYYRYGNKYAYGVFYGGISHKGESIRFGWDSATNQDIFQGGIHSLIRNAWFQNQHKKSRPYFMYGRGISNMSLYY